MLAVVEIAGQQFEVEQNKKLVVPLLEGNPGDTVEFDNILLAKEGDDIKIGLPSIKGKVTAKILDHGKGDRVLVFHKKRRKGHRKLNGHRTKFTSIEITNIAI